MKQIIGMNAAYSLKGPDAYKHGQNFTEWLKTQETGLNKITHMRWDYSFQETEDKNGKV